MNEHERNQIIEQLINAIGDSNRVLTEMYDLYSYAFDASFGNYKPDVVCQPLSTEDVVQIVKIARAFHVSVIPRGTGTSLSGGPLPVDGGIVLDFSRWDTTLEINPDDLVAVASPGVITAHINEKASEY